ncbi:MAG: type II secretion system protein GspF [Desulfobacterales bacterium C00003106]|jgi:general secretion pathway protein F|nr:MAG: type II secretion system protein GspF [Desulfobacterales bacterium C00003106]OEU59248.1 MAG: type II secretion system protein GspF [Desulfobacterales bacterium C00003104]
MPVYAYKALDDRGKNKNGITDAESLVAARQKLRNSGLFPVEVQETQAETRISSRQQVEFIKFFNRVKASDITVMTRQLGILLGAGLPLVTSLNALIQQTTKESLAKIIVRIKEDVNEGQSLAAALSRYENVFSLFYINIIRAGEASGTLDVVLNRLAELREKQQALAGRIRAALAYPVFMFLIGSFILIFLMTFIVPRVTQVFEEMKQALPIPTVILITVSDFLKSFWWIIILLIVGGTIALFRFTRTPKGRLLRDRVILAFPVFGDLKLKVLISHFTQTLGALIQNGVPLLSSLEIAKNIVNNSVIADIIQKAREDVSEGRDLASALATDGIFPPIVVQMISVGEQSGELEQMLFHVAAAYENEVESNIVAMTSLLEPVMILAMAVVVGFVVTAILLPIFEMSQLIR